MYLGQVVARAPVKALFGSPKHPYSEGLLQSKPKLDRALACPLLPLTHRPPSPFAPPPGCPFHPRCPERIEGVCDREVPVVESLPDGSEVRYHLWRSQA